MPFGQEKAASSEVAMISGGNPYNGLRIDPKGDRCHCHLLPMFPYWKP